jgi:hypothetical protein
MPSNPLSKLVNPRYPSAAVGLESGAASVVLLERRRSVFTLKRAGTITLSDSLIRPSFEEPNLASPAELADALAELVSSAGLTKQRKWSVALPEAATRALILTLEAVPNSRAELDELLNWKTERSFGHPVEELRVARERLSVDAQGRPRYLAVSVQESVLAEYETVFAALGWRTGLVLPRHVGELRWLMRNGATAGDALLISSHTEGFTAVLVRERHPTIVRSVVCEPEDREDELYRLLLFYRDRVAQPEHTAEVYNIERLLVVGDGFGRGRVGEIINETLGTNLTALSAEDVGLALPSADLSFDAIAAPAGLATLAWD